MGVEGAEESGIENDRLLISKNNEARTKRLFFVPERTYIRDWWSLGVRLTLVVRD